MKPYMDSFERELSQGLKESAGRIITPDKKEVWAEIEREIQGNQKKRQHLYLKSWRQWQPYSYFY